MKSGTAGAARHRGVAWRMSVRCGTALVGGYGAAAGMAALAGRLLPIARVEATAWAMILSFLLFASIGLWAFHEPRLWRVAGIIWGTAILCAGALYLLGARP